MKCFLAKPKSSACVESCVRTQAWACVAVLAIAATACQSKQANAPVPSPTPSTQATSPPSPSSSSPFPNPTTTPAGEALCTFPVAGFKSNGDVTGYFMTVPSGVKTLPQLVFRQSGTLHQTVDKPFLLGSGLGFYDRAFGRWIPADAAAVSPDGTHYAYGSGAAQGPNELHIVDVGTGTDRLITNVGRYWPLDYRSDGLYLREQSTSGLWAGSGIFVLDLKTNVIRRLHSATRAEWWTATLGNFAYGSDLNPSDPNSPGWGETSDELVRADLRTGAVIRFQYHPGQRVAEVAITPSGQLLARIGALGIQSIDASGNAVPIPGTPTGAIAFIDSQRTWLYVDEPAPTTSAFGILRLYLLSKGRAVHVMDSKWDLGSRFVGACRQR